jgi:hypothetical protein
MAANKSPEKQVAPRKHVFPKALAFQGTPSSRGFQNPQSLAIVGLATSGSRLRKKPSDLADLRACPFGVEPAMPSNPRRLNNRAPNYRDLRDGDRRAGASAVNRVVNRRKHRSKAPIDRVGSTETTVRLRIPPFGAGCQPPRLSACRKRENLRFPRSHAPSAVGLFSGIG